VIRIPPQNLLLSSHTEQILDMIIAIATIDDDPGYLEPIPQTTLDGLRPPNDGEPASDSRAPTRSLHLRRRLGSLDEATALRRRRPYDEGGVSHGKAPRTAEPIGVAPGIGDKQGRRRRAGCVSLPL
jgi:hypothetical protein